MTVSVKIVIVQNIGVNDGDHNIKDRSDLKGPHMYLMALFTFVLISGELSYLLISIPVSICVKTVAVTRFCPDENLLLVTGSIQFQHFHPLGSLH